MHLPVISMYVCMYVRMCLPMLRVKRCTPGRVAYVGCCVIYGGASDFLLMRSGIVDTVLPPRLPFLFALLCHSANCGSQSGSNKAQSKESKLVTCAIKSPPRYRGTPVPSRTARNVLWKKKREKKGTKKKRKKNRQPPKYKRVMQPLAAIVYFRLPGIRKNIMMPHMHAVIYKVSSPHELVCVHLWNIGLID
jgi:hypothetical protein